jgi:hypothetical protein
MTQLVKQWQQGAAGELLIEAWCLECGEHKFQVLGLLWWAPGIGYAQADTLCLDCQLANLQEAYVYPTTLPEPYRLFVVHAGCQTEPVADDYKVLVAALSPARSRHLEQLYRRYYVPFTFTGEHFAGHLLH